MSSTPIAVLYATREGQTRKIAEHVAANLRSTGRHVDVLDLAHLPASFDLVAYDGAILAASVHATHHEREMIAFVRAHRAQLDAIPTAFLSVSLSEAGAEQAAAPPEKRAAAAADAQRMIDRFCEETGWRPRAGDAKPVAGALAYSKYGLFKRFALKQLAKRAGGDTDTSRDWEYTDWPALDAFVAAFLPQVAA